MIDGRCVDASGNEPRVDVDEEEMGVRFIAREGLDPGASQHLEAHNLIAGRIGAEERERRRVVRCVVLAVVCVMEVVLVVWKMNKIQEQATHLTTTPAQLCKAQQAGLLRVVCVCADGVI